MNIQRYTPIPATLTVPESEWKEVLVDFIAKHGVKWNSKRVIKAPPEETRVPEASEAPKKRRILVKNYIWYADFLCHRNGSKRDQVAEGYIVRGGSSGKVRERQKASKKIGCPAKLKVTCFKNDPTNVVFTHIGEHNHEIGGLEDLRHLPLSTKTRAMIQERLEEGHAQGDTPEQL